MRPVTLVEETNQCATVTKFVSLRLTSLVDLVPQTNVHQQVLVIHPPVWPATQKRQAVPMITNTIPDLNSPPRKI